MRVVVLIVVVVTILVTPAALVDAIVTEKGVVIEPNQKKIADLMA